MGCEIPGHEGLGGTLAGRERANRGDGQKFWDQFPMEDDRFCKSDRVAVTGATRPWCPEGATGWCWLPLHRK
ncbi:MAG: hypothetical protein EA001_02360 [Oscillatoriales cyanobacterium]|nr:MAG: hypothetical protein EA001_02360 [Oscillatoriales cyanobacterium]